MERAFQLFLADDTAWQQLTEWEDEAAEMLGPAGWVSRRPSSLSGS